MLSLLFSRWQFALYLYAIIVILIVIFKPSSLFRSDGTLKKWGAKTDENTSIIAAQITFPILAIVCYYIVICIDLAYER